MRTLSDLAALAAGLTADLLRREGPLRRAPRAILASLTAGLHGVRRLVLEGERRRAAALAVRALAAATLSALARGTVRTRDLTVHAVRTGIDSAARVGRRSLDGSRPQVGALSDATSRGIASLARSVLALPGGPGPVVAGALAVLALAGYAWTQPAASDRVQLRPFVVEYAFDYRAPLPPNLVYEQSEIRIGDPIFLGVVDAVDVTVDWTVPRGDVVVSGGRLAVTTLLRSEAGWTRVLERVPEVPVDGLRASSGVRIDFPAAMELARRVDDAAGVSRPVRLEVLVETLLDDPVTLSGAGMASVDGYSAATIAFLLDERVIRLADIPIASPRPGGDPLAGLLPGTGSASTETGDASTGTGRASTETGATSRFSQAAPGSVATGGRIGVREVVQMFATDVLEPNDLRLGPLRIEVRTARRNFTLLGLALLASGLLGLRVLRRIEQLGEAAVIEARYGPILTPLPVGVNGHGAHAIDVGSFDALHTLAIDRDTPIMVDRSHRPGEVAHYLFDGPTTYRYIARGRPLSPSSVPRGVDIPLDEDGPTVDAGGPTTAS